MASSGSIEIAQSPSLISTSLKPTGGLPKMREPRSWEAISQTIALRPLAAAASPMA